MSATSMYFIFASVYRIQAHTDTQNYEVFEFGNDLIPFIRGERGQCVTPIEAPVEKHYFLK